MAFVKQSCHRLRIVRHPIVNTRFESFSLLDPYWRTLAPIAGRVTLWKTAKSFSQWPVHEFKLLRCDRAASARLIEHSLGRPGSHHAAVAVISTRRVDHVYYDLVSCCELCIPGLALNVKCRLHCAGWHPSGNKSLSRRVVVKSPNTVKPLSMATATTAKYPTPGTAKKPCLSVVKAPGQPPT